MNNEKITLKDSLRKLSFKDIDEFHLGWYSKYNYILAYSALYRHMCIHGCGLCYGWEQGLLRLFIESLNGCEESLEFLGDYWATILLSSKRELASNPSREQLLKDFEPMKRQTMKFGDGFDPTKQEIETFFDKALLGLRSHLFKSNNQQGYGVDDVTNLKIFFDRKFFMFLNWYLPREKIHDELCGSSAQGFLREMEVYSGDYGTEDNTPYIPGLSELKAQLKLTTKTS